MKLETLGNSVADLLDAFVEQLNLIPGFELPPNHYVGAGEIPWDGEGLYAYLGSTYTGQPGRPNASNIPATQGLTSGIGIYIMLVRSVSTFGYWAAQGPMPASDDQLNAEGIRALNDVGALIIAATAIKRDGLIVSSKQAGFVIGQCTPLGPQGELAAVRLFLDLSIEQ